MTKVQVSKGIVCALKCSNHPRYKVKLKPRCVCEYCWFLWFNKQGREYFGW